MKILILGFSKIKFMPYVNFYLDNLDKEKHEIHFLYWNRDLQDEDVSAYKDVHLHEFKLYQKDQDARLHKIKSFFAYKRYAKKLLRKEKFDFVFALHSLPGVILSGCLTKKYKNKYVFDYRDSTYERFDFFKKIIAKLVRNSYATFVSSAAFKQLLPQDAFDKVYISHNLLEDSLLHRTEKKQHGVQSDKIRISFWGLIRGESINREVVKRIAADNRFELHYYGREQTTALNLKEYVKELGATNVFFHGEYKPTDRYQFVCETDIIHNVYFDKNMMMAMPNKYYDGLIFYLPQICMKGSFMGQCATQSGVGIEVDPNDPDFTEQIANYYAKINVHEFEDNCDKALEKILKEYQQGASLINKI